MTPNGMNASETWYTSNYPVIQASTINKENYNGLYRTNDLHTGGWTNVLVGLQGQRLMETIETCKQVVIFDHGSIDLINREQSSLTTELF